MLDDNSLPISLAIGALCFCDAVRAGPAVWPVESDRGRLTILPDGQTPQAGRNISKVRRFGVQLLKLSIGPALFALSLVNNGSPIHRFVK